MKTPHVLTYIRYIHTTYSGCQTRCTRRATRTHMREMVKKNPSRVGHVAANHGSRVGMSQPGEWYISQRAIRDNLTWRRSPPTEVRSRMPFVRQSEGMYVSLGVVEGRISLEWMDVGGERTRRDIGKSLPNRRLRKMKENDEEKKKNEKKPTWRAYWP